MTEEQMSFVLIGFGLGLQGEEIPLISLQGLLFFFWDETRSDPDPFIMITLYGRFKGETRYRWHCLPICDDNRSRILFRKLIGWLLRRKVMLQRRESGWLFWKEKRRAKISDYDEMFLHYIMRVHTLYPSLFSVGTLIHPFSTWRFIQWGAVLETTGQVNGVVVTLMNCWRTKECTKGSSPGLTVRQTYTQIRGVFLQLELYPRPCS